VNLKICSKVLKENLRGLCVKKQNQQYSRNKKSRFFLRQNDKVNVLPSLSETPLRTKNILNNFKETIACIAFKKKPLRRFKKLRKDRFFLRQNDKVSVSPSLSETPLRMKNVFNNFKEALHLLLLKKKTIKNI